jgi:succinate-semialdehyde dehydrogenase / glutarate-semialdehyde dehydrogenase
MEFESINPFNDQVIGVFQPHTDHDISNIVKTSEKTFKKWKNESINFRSELMLKAADLLIENSEQYAELISLEMGKPITEAKAEINKCAWVCEFYAENSEEFLADEIIESDADESFISYEPLGTILAIMPWNFPFWQVFRFAAPTLMAGNAALLKHATNVLGCAEAIEQIFRDAGFPEGLFQQLRITHEQVDSIIADDIIKAVTVTGSERAGSSVAMKAGKQIKKSVLELGGSNAFIVAADSDLKRAAETGVKARMMNSGQSCIAAKRFIVEKPVFDDFLELFVHQVKHLKPGDPLNEDTQIGPLARKDLAEVLENQINKSIEQGAKLITGGTRNGAYIEPAVLTDVVPGMPAFDEETFGPLAAFTIADNLDHTFELAGKSKFGLGVSIFTSNTDRAIEYTDRVADGAYFINDLVKSDPRLPFGGTRNSGYGRELSREGILEFVNIKTVYVCS